MVDAAGVKALETLVAKLQEDPTLVYSPELGFFKDFILSWGAKIPSSKASSGAGAAAGANSGPQRIDPQPEKKVESEPEEESEEEKEEEEEDPERLPEDPEPYPDKGPEGEVELTDEQMDKQGEFKQAAAEALEDGDMQKALDKFTEAVKIGNVSAMMYAKRAEMLLKLKRPCACIADCDAALAINPDSAKAYKIRGKAHRKLGHWEKAHQDLATGQKLDFEDDLVDVQKFVDHKFKKIEEKRVKQRIKDEKRKVKEMKKRKEEAKRAYEEAKRAESSGGFPGGMGGFPGGMGGFPGGMGGFPGMPGGMGMPGGIDPSMLQGLMSDPELLQAFSNPKMAAAMQDIMSNPGNIGKYQNDPEVMAVMQKIMGKFGGGMGGMPGGGGGCPAAGGGGGGGSGPVVEECDADEVD